MHTKMDFSNQVMKLGTLDLDPVLKQLEGNLLNGIQDLGQQCLHTQASLRRLDYLTSVLASLRLSALMSLPKLKIQLHKEVEQLSGLLRRFEIHTVEMASSLKCLEHQLQKTQQIGGNNAKSLVQDS